jgi:hypothetical protein
MNELLSNTHAPILEAALLRQARATAQQNGLHLLSVLEELTSWDQRVLLKALALPFGYKVVETQDMFGLLQDLMFCRSRPQCKDNAYYCKTTSKTSMQ